MKYVVKLGGAGLETPSLLDGSMRAIIDLVRDGNQVAVVHGGGVQLTRTLKAMGKESRFIDGLRITDAETRDVALMVFAGKAPSAKTHFMHAADNLSAYSVFTHRHAGELLEQIDLDKSQIVFTPHLLPIPRGILSTIYVRFSGAQTADSISSIYRDFFADSPMVRLHGKTLPQIQHSVHTNYADIGFQLALDGQRCVIVSCLDNLLKGASSQAVQNLNVMQGWREAEGLE